MKRLVCVLIAAVLVLIAVTVPVYADTAQIEFDKSRVNCGKIIIVTLKYSAPYNIYGIVFNLNYNNSVLQYEAGGTNLGSQVRIVEALSGEKYYTAAVAFRAISAGECLFSFTAEASGDGKGSGTALGTVEVYCTGDINGDGKLNNKDLTRLFQYLSKWDVKVNNDMLDVNGDSKVNNKDLTRLFQYLSGWNVEIF